MAQGGTPSWYWPNADFGLRISDSGQIELVALNGVVALTILTDGTIVGAGLRAEDFADPVSLQDLVTLNYFNTHGGGGGGGSVTSVFGRTGIVVAVSGDYTASQVGALAATATLGGDLSGNAPNPLVVALQGHAVAATAPTTNYVLTWNGSAWAPAVLPASAVTSVFTRTGAVTAQTGDYTAAQVGALASTDGVDTIAGLNATAADWSNNSHKITSVKDPTAAQDAATKNYVDTAINGLDWKASVVLATTTALPANVYNNGASGVGATLTGVTTGVLSIDGTAVVVGERVLVKNEVAPANNGIYVVTTIGTSPALYVLTRSADYNQASEIAAGDAVYVTTGTANVDTSWVMTTTTTPIVVGATSLVWSQFGGNLVTSVFTRTGAVTAQTGDYTDAQVTSSPTNVLTTTGDLLYASGANTLARLAVGTSSQVLVGGTTPAWGSAPAPGVTRSSRSSNTILAAGDKGSWIDASAAYTQTLTAPATLGAGWWCYLKNDSNNGTNLLTVTSASGNIDGITGTTGIVMYSGDTRLLTTDGNNFFTFLIDGGYAKFTPGTDSFIVPTGIEHLDVVCIGSGGQGGGGLSGASSAAGGGAGGGGASVTRAILRASDFTPGATVTVTVGAGGSATGSAGSSGSNGAATSFGSYLNAYGGGGGAAGTTTSNISGGGASVANSASGTSGGAPTSTTAIGGQGVPGVSNNVGNNAEWGGASGGAGGQGAGQGGESGGSSIFGGAGGGGGGGANNATLRTGGAGGATQSYTVGGGGAGGASLGAQGTNGTSLTGPYCGTGGGGGASNSTGTGGLGGTGGIGDGGGGGGGAFNGTGGAGGAGGAGECRVFYG